MRRLSKTQKQIIDSLQFLEYRITWNGQTNDGKEASSGVYFYHAEVIFDTNEPARQKQEFEGWVQVIR